MKDLSTTVKTVMLLLRANETGNPDADPEGSSPEGPGWGRRTEQGPKFNSGYDLAAWRWQG